MFFIFNICFDIANRVQQIKKTKTGSNCLNTVPKKTKYLTTNNIFVFHLKIRRERREKKEIIENFICKTLTFFLIRKINNKKVLLLVGYQ